MCEFIDCYDCIGHRVRSASLELFGTDPDAFRAHQLERATNWAADTLTTWKTINAQIHKEVEVRGNTSSSPMHAIPASSGLLS